MNGKGDKRRPQRVDREQFESNWDKAFGKKMLTNLHTFWSDNGKRSSNVLINNLTKVYVIECLQKSKIVRSDTKNFEFEAEIVAENWCLGVE